MEADVELGAGEAQPVSGGQVSAVVREVGVARAGHHPGHRVQAHPEHRGVRAQGGGGPEGDGALNNSLYDSLCDSLVTAYRAPGHPRQLRGLPDQGQQRGPAGGEAGGRVRPGHEHQLGQRPGAASVPDLERPHDVVPHLLLRLQLQLIGPDELGAGEEREVIPGGGGEEGDEELHLAVPHVSPHGPVREGQGGHDDEVGGGLLPGVH